MISRNTRWGAWRLAGWLIAGSCASCGGGGAGTSGAGQSDFHLSHANLANGCVWQINRPITLEFSQPIDFSSVNSSSIRISQTSGTPAVGEFSLIDPRTISFQPRCPRKPDFSDAGLRPGATDYLLEIVGAANFSIRSASGAPLSVGEQRAFTTPETLEPASLFFDSVAGAPTAVVRGEGSLSSDASCVEIGGDPSARVYFERSSSGASELAGGFSLPPNLWSDASTQVAFLIAFDQPVDPSNSNLVASRLRIEFQGPLGEWSPLQSRLSLDENCAGSGSVVRIQPEGMLPPRTQLRVFQAAEFRDLVGEMNVVDRTDFAPTKTAASSERDSIEEEFTVGGSEPGSHEDALPALGQPSSSWGGGALTAVLGFGGSGGAGGEFDWEVRSGETFVLDTTISTLVGGPGFAQVSQQEVVGGFADLRNFRVVQGGVLRIQGPNPATIFATGFVQIDGTIEISGVDSPGVSTLHAPMPQLGAPGVAGGGRGGAGSPLINASSPKGGAGQGAFGLPDAGGDGGETTYWTGGFSNPDATRGTGGGGGRLGADQLTTLGIADQTFIGLDAEQGFTNLFVPPAGQPLPIGASSGLAPPRGGAPGRSPFVDGNPDNDFFGQSFDATTKAVTLGELTRPWAGGGGGGGGDAVASTGGPFPPLPFSPFANPNGAGGGGGGGSLRILALGSISFGPVGTLKCRGGTGGGGENTNFLNRIGGGSGGGSGGHVVLESASKIDFSHATTAGQVSILATGGQGGAGAQNLGGAQLGAGGSQETTPIQDACPTGFPTNQCRGPVSGAGGDGGPGLIQLHTCKGLGGGDILLPPGRTLAELCKPTPVSASATKRLIASFGRNSIGRSVWIPIGLGGFDSHATSSPFFKPVSFDFDGIDPTSGEVHSSSGVVDLGPTLLGPVNIQMAPTLPFIAISGRTIVMDASALVGGPQEYFLANTGLLKRSSLRLSRVGAPAENMCFDVVVAVYRSSSIPPTLELTVSSQGPPLSAFTPAGVTAAELIPTFFKLNTNGVANSLPATAAVYIRFQAAPATAEGLPDAAHAVPADWVSDVGVLNSSPNRELLRYMRFEVEFDVDRLGTGVTLQSPRPALDFLRLPFRY